MNQPEINKNNLARKLDGYLQCVGSKMLALRKTHKKSIKVVAKATKMSPGIISKVEKGQHETLCLSRLLRLCKYYKVNVIDIVTCE
jgi:transcriptional regulator with XRE-family HTH domain